MGGQVATSVVNVGLVIDRAGIGMFQIAVFALCAIAAALDGYDTQVIGYTAPLVLAHVGAPMSALGPIFSAGVVGATCGAFLFGPLADRFGRKWLLVCACWVFAAFTLATPYVTSVGQLLALRFLAGLGLGGATPSFLALGAEYAPARRRSLVVTALFAAFPFGGFIGGLASSFLIPSFGWQAIFVAGGVAPLLIGGIVAIWLPESLRHLLAQGGSQQAARRILGRIAGSPVASDALLVVGEGVPSQRHRVAQLFTDGRAARTIFLWVPFFMGFMVLLTVTAWTPAVLRAGGVPLAAAALVIAANNLGSVVGTALCGHLIDRVGPFRSLIPGFMFGAAALAMFGGAAGSLAWLTAASAIAGFMVGGASSGMIALAALLYPTVIRSTGIGWGMGMGRLGQIIGPLALGALVARQVTLPMLFVAAATPCLIAAAALLALRVYMRSNGLGALGDDLAPATSPFPD